MRFSLVVGLSVCLTGSAMAQLAPGYRRETMPAPHMACFVPPAPGFGGTTCRTQPGARGSPCRCGDLPYAGQKDVARF